MAPKLERRIRALLAREGWSVSRKQVQRIRRKEGLKVRPKPKRIPRQGVSTALPIEATHRNHVWTWDFIFDRTDKGSTLIMLAMMAYGLPEHIRSDNGTEFIAKKSNDGSMKIRSRRST